MEATVAHYQRKARDLVYNICHFKLPFNVIKSLKLNDISKFINKDGGISLTFRLWHADQSRHNATTIEGIKQLKLSLD